MAVLVNVSAFTHVLGFYLETAKTILQGKIETIDFDVFLCYNTEDKPKIRMIGKQLKNRGILPWLDEWELRPGLPWQRALEQQISHIRSAAVFVGSSGIGPWQLQELGSLSKGICQSGFSSNSCSLAKRKEGASHPTFLKKDDMGRLSSERH